MENVAWCILDELIEYLLVEVNHKFILTSKLQSDYIELKFSEYWQPNGGGFYLTFNQINSEEKMCRTKSCLNLGWRAIELDDGEYQELTKIATQDFFELTSTMNTCPGEIKATVYIVGYVLKKFSQFCSF